jgi:ribosomal protein S18 acetylase RimI-like enzyme
MPRLTDRGEIRTILEADRAWAAYALADLQPGLFEHATWFARAGDARALALIYSGFRIPVLITVGATEELRVILDEIESAPHLRELYVVVRPEAIAVLRDRYRLSHEKAMQRMILNPARYKPTETGGVVALGPAELEAVQRLYADGAANAEAPDWFVPEMLAHGVYRGAREAGELVAIAGTHVVTVSEGVGCLGNIYTRRDRRGRGLSTRVTSSVTAHLLSMNLRTIALNVREDNIAAIRVYERLGFQHYCGFIEAFATKF